MVGNSSMGILGFIVPLWVATGVLILLIDRKHYQTNRMNKEKKAAGFLGWLNISIGVVWYIINLIVKILK